VPFTKNLDVIQQAQSGTGKTATFCAGILNNLDYNLLECQALVLAPTRELAQQIEKVMRALGDYLQVGRGGGGAAAGGGCAAGGGGGGRRAGRSRHCGFGVHGCWRSTPGLGRQRRLAAAAAAGQPGLHAPPGGRPARARPRAALQSQAQQPRGGAQAAAGPSTRQPPG
jgi:hypothetical protein